MFGARENRLADISSYISISEWIAFQLINFQLPIENPDFCSPCTQLELGFLDPCNLAAFPCPLCPTRNLSNMSDPIKMKKSKRSRDTPTTDPITPTLDLAPPAATTDVSPAKKSKRSSKSLDDSPTAEAASATADASTEPTDDGPALSHKEKRLAKRRKLAGLPERAPAPPPDSVAAIQSSSVPTIGSQRAPGSHQGGITVGATPAKGAHGIWVGNMNFATTSKDLLAWFEERGLKEVTRINMPKGKRSHENNRGCVYISLSLLLPARRRAHSSPSPCVSQIRLPRLPHRNRRHHRRRRLGATPRRPQAPHQILLRLLWSSHLPRRSPPLRPPRLRSNPTHHHHHHLLLLLRRQCSTTAQNPRRPPRSNSQPHRPQDPRPPTQPRWPDALFGQFGL